MSDEPQTPPAPPPAADAGADVFISYARANRPTAEQLAAALAAQSIGVWWDRELLAGSEFAEAIEAQLQSARVVLALWSADSVRSAFVRIDALRAVGVSLRYAERKMQVAGAWLMLPTVRERIGYAGQKADPAPIELAVDEISSGILDDVLERGSIFRPVTETTGT